MGIIGTTEKIKSKMANVLAEREHVDYEQEGSKHQTLGNPMADRGGVGLCC